MTKIKIPNVSNSDSIDVIIKWMNENIGICNLDWYWANMRSFDASVLIRDKNKAVFAMLRWDQNDCMYSIFRTVRSRYFFTVDGRECWKI